MPGRKAKSGTKAEPKAEDQVDDQAKINVEVPEEKEADESKAPIEAKVDDAEKADGGSIKEATESREPRKSGRGRTKKAEGEEPVPKKSKTVKPASKPIRASQRVSNQKRGVKLPDVKEEITAAAPKKKTKIAKKTGIPSKIVAEPNEEAASNGAAEEAVES